MSDSFYESLATGSQIVAAILFIVVLIYLWNRFLAPAVLKAQASKNAELLEAEQRRDAAKTEIQAARDEAAAAESDARAITARGEAESARLHERIVAEAQAESERLVHNAQGELERGRIAAREKLRDDLLAQAIAIARRAALDVDDATNRRLVSETVDTADREGRS